MGKVFKDILTKKRAEKSIGMVALGEKIGKSRSYISNLEKGLMHPPPREICEAIVDVLKISGDDRDKFLEAAAHERRHCDPWYAEMLESENAELEKRLNRKSSTVKTKRLKVREDAKMYGNIYAPMLEKTSDIQSGDQVQAIIHKMNNRELANPHVVYAVFHETGVPGEILLLPFGRNPKPILIDRNHVELRRLSSEAERLF